MKNPHTLIISLILTIIFVTSGSSVSFSQDKSIEELYFQGVDLLENKKQYEEALTYFQQTIELDPNLLYKSEKYLEPLVNSKKP